MEIIRIVLTESKNISGAIRKPGHILLEAICLKKIAEVDISEALRLGQAIVVIEEFKKEDKEISQY